MIKIFNRIMKKMALNRYNTIVSSVMEDEEKYKMLSVDDLKKQLLTLKKDDFNEYKEALSLISELSYRFFELRPFASQLTGSLVLNDGMIAEMKTGEGKTLVAVISLILNYLSNKNAHIVTANDYLVKRDYDFSKPLFDFIGMTSSFIDEDQTVTEKIEVYNCDVVYSTSKGLVFDYLRINRFKSENMLFNEKRDFIIVDEVDFVLIDEARTPIILSGILQTDRELYLTLQELQKEFIGANKIKEDQHNDPDFFYTGEMLELTEKGYNLLENKLIEKGLISDKGSLYDGNGFKYIKSMERALRANYIWKKDVHYLVINEEIITINHQTGRPQPGRRFSDGLHQALEAKENVKINDDAQSLAQTTLQNYLKKYNKMSGMTGTALTEEAEFKEFYFMRVLPIKPNKPLIRLDGDDILFLNKKGMKKGMLTDLKENLRVGRPTLIGVQSVTDSEDISNFLSSEDINFEVLDAKNHEREAYVIEQAGKTGSVTIATNMAGRGTDIMLGGNKEIVTDELLKNNQEMTREEADAIWQKEHDLVVEAGGLSVMGIGRSDSRRLDNQLIGRSGRQGDPGMTKYYLNLDDSLFLNISTTFLRGQWAKDNEDQPISANIISRIIRETQKTSESNSFNMRKSLLRFDNINTEQREIFYSWRRNVVCAKDLSSVVNIYFKDVIRDIIRVNTTVEEFLSNNLEAIEKDFNKYLGLDMSIRDIFEKESLNDEDDFIEYIYQQVIKNYEEKSKIIGKKDMLIIERELLLDLMDQNWAENISNLEEMRISTGLRSYAQKNPLDEYQKEALEMFNNLVSDIKKDYCLTLRKFSPFSILEQREKIKKINEENYEKEQYLKGTTIDVSKLKFLPSPVEGIGI